jgi:hypothetical protein
MAKKRITQNEEVIINDNVEAEITEAPVVATVKMARYDRAEPIEVPADQVERYKQSSWKVV